MTTEEPQVTATGRPATSSIDAIASTVDAREVDLGRHSSPAGAVTIVFSDIEGSTAMIETLGEERWFRVMKDHDLMVRREVEAHGGTVVKSQGDGFMIAFASAHAALRCAIDLQRTFAGDPDDEGEERIRTRIGLHAGSVIADADDFFGKNVILAARIADYARGGEIVVSGELKEYTESDPSFRFADRRSISLKGLSGTHVIYTVRWDENGRGV